MEYKIIPTFPNQIKSRFSSDKKFADDEDSYRSFVPPSDMEFVAEDNTKIRKPIIKIPTNRQSTLDRRYGSSPPTLYGSSPTNQYGISPPLNHGSSPPVVYGSAPKEYQPIYGLSPNEHRMSDHYFHENHQGNPATVPVYHEQPKITNDPVGMAVDPDYKVLKRKPVETIRSRSSEEFSTSRSNTINSTHSQENTSIQSEITGKPIFVSMFENTRPTELVFVRHANLGVHLGIFDRIFLQNLWENPSLDDRVYVPHPSSIFVLTKVLTYCELVTINWEKIEVLAQKHLDIDGDGKLTMYDALFMIGKCLCHFALNVPTSVGFCSSIWFGYNW
ncbi:hypothetical protein HDV06_004898 [Boothiomyces sp. JEL0866]|nr:hypothetical protein HDV06_004898 [Boothiomyces sp. JEL0866]